MTTVYAAQGELRKDIEYGRAGDQSLQMDAWIPDGPGPFPAAIIVHGGAWVAGDRRTNVQPLFRPLEDAGIAWFSVSYRLAKDVTQFGAGIMDVEDSIRYIRAHAAQYRIDPDRVALIGESAGGQIASMAALAPSMGVRAVVALYSPSDLVTLAKTTHYIPENVRRQIEGTPWEALVLQGLKQLSPINNVRRDMPPFLLIHGTSDALVPYQQSEAMCRAVRGAGGSCELYAVKGGGHGVRWWESERLTAYKHVMTDWLKTQLSSPLPRV